MNTTRSDIFLILIAVAGWVLFGTAAAATKNARHAEPYCTRLDTGQTVMTDGVDWWRSECLPGIGELPPAADEHWPPLPRTARPYLP